MVVKYLILIYFFGSVYAVNKTKVINSGGPLGCDFKSNNFCEWSNDETASDDWSITPDYEVEGNNYYMRWDPSLLQEGTARLISPVYIRDLDGYGCFTFYYKIETQSRSNGLRVYQKPDNITLEDFLAYSDDAKQDYILFEDCLEWKEWRYKVLPLKRFDKNFQIIIEGLVYNKDEVREVGVDDIAILLGSKCEKRAIDCQCAAEFKCVVRK
ncbi:uncharacterized protein LOC123877379 [Maniola jurtina]|uniref:uncharacterized protein LOC123877379 n=1 Tax=Maniola jurtina TaxID=191418 RepID=UPI001E68E2D3|nr:uncharacterized protein LOC123877379 [Maniola jurtina]